MTTNAGTIVGIDLGTTFSAIAYLDRAGTPVTIPNAEGDLTTPSAILFESDGSVVVGKQALRAAMVQPERVATCVKRDMGETFYGRIVAGRRWKPQHLSAFILRKLKQDAERRIGPVRGAVVTVPAYYDEARRQATIDAGKIAGLHVVDIINEPTAAALAYAFRRVSGAAGQGDALERLRVAPPGATVMVYDLGGGTFDVTVIRQIEHQVHVLATDGDLFLGGKDWDERIVDYSAKLFIDQHGVDPREDSQCCQELWRACEEAKKDLSARRSTMFSVNHAGSHLGVSLARDQFEQMTNDLLYRTESRIVRVLRNAKLSWADIGEVILVGGSSRMPQVREMVAAVSGKAPNDSLAFDEIVAHGAAVHGAILQAQGKVDSALESFGGSLPPDMPPVLLPAIDLPEALPPAGPSLPPPPIPAPAKPAKVVKPAPAAPAPAAAAPAPVPVQRARTKEPVDDIVKALERLEAFNVNAHSLGVAAHSDKDGEELNSVIIPRNTPLPASKTKRYGTMSDGQKFIRIRVIEGESRTPEACIPVGECVIGPLPPGLPRKSPVTVTFRYDGSGCLHVDARQDDTGMATQSVIVRPRAIGDNELARAVEAMSRVNIS
jgi:molecular chaperone DnaK